MSEFIKSSSAFRDGNYWIFSSILLAIFITTSSPYNYLIAITQGFPDVSSYLKIAQTQDYYAFYLLSQDIQLHHLERWPIHVLIGKIALLTQWDIWAAYKSTVLVCLFLATILIANLKCSTLQKLAYLALVIFSPYTFRIYYGVPAMLSDCIFYICIIGFSVAIINHHFFLITLFALFACLCRQTGVMLIPILLVYAYQKKISFAYISASLISVLFGFIFIKSSTYFLFQPTENAYLSRVLLGIFYWAAGAPHLSEFSDFIGRFILMILTLTPLLIIVNKVKKSDWFYILGFCLILLQPLLGGPIITGGNIDRLAIYGLPILGLVLINQPISQKQLVLFIALVIACSFHPHLTVLQKLDFNREAYIFLVLIAACISCAIWIKKNILTKPVGVIS